MSDNLTKAPSIAPMLNSYKPRWKLLLNALYILIYSVLLTTLCYGIGILFRCN
jgi:hypothetical protein